MRHAREPYRAVVVATGDLAGTWPGSALIVPWFLLAALPAIPLSLVRPWS